MSGTDENLLPKDQVDDPLKVNADVGIELQVGAEAKSETDPDTSKSLISGMDNVSVTSDNYNNYSSSEFLKKLKKGKKVLINIV